MANHVAYGMNRKLLNAWTMPQLLQPKAGEALAGLLLSRFGTKIHGEMTRNN
jgi:hypothetical protein